MRYLRLTVRVMGSLAKCAVVIAAVLLIAANCGAQATPASRQAKASDSQSVAPWLDQLSKNPDLVAALNKLTDRVQHEVRYPAARGTSQIMPLLAESTTVYAAFPNYGGVADQILKIFREELQQNAALRTWWNQGPAGAVGPKVEDAFAKFSQVSQYLGDEIVISGTVEFPNPKFAMVAQARKPGLKAVLQQILNESAGQSQESLQVLDPEDLATAKARPGQGPVVLVRPDYVIAAPDLDTLRSFNAHLNRNARTFASTPFGQRVSKAYGDGLTVLAAADLHRIISQVPAGKDRLTFERTGFADLQYLVWEHSTVEGRAVSRTELSFTGPRHGAASWLAKPAPLGGLDYVSPNAVMALSILLKNPAEIYDDIEDIASASKAKPFAALESFEQMTGIDVKRDLLSKLSGEITLELDSTAPPMPAWKGMLGVKDADSLRQTLNTLLTAINMPPEPVEDGGNTYYTLRIPSPQKEVEIAYTFADGYLVIGSSREAAAEAIRLHKNGNSLAKSQKFLAAMPPGHPAGASAVFYQDPIAMTALQARQFAPDLAASFAKLAGTSAPTVSCAYGEETVIRGESTSPAMDTSFVLVAAAIAIPNLIRSRIAANEASAASMTRTVLTAQITYAATYPDKGYAPDLASLGPDPGGSGAVTAEHASLIDGEFAGPSCKAGTWCTKSGYRFNVSAECKGKSCTEFVVVSTPIGTDSGTRSFCTTSDAVLRVMDGPPLISPISASECRGWAPRQ